MPIFLFIISLSFCQSGNAALIGHWELDDSTGSTAVDSAGTHPGALENFPGDDSQWVTGHDGSGALDFDGVDDRVEMAGANIAAGFDVTADFTWVAWVKSSGVSTKAGMISFAPSGAAHVNGNKILSLQPDGTVSLLAHSVILAPGYTSAVSVNDNTWHHVAVTVEHDTNGSNDTIKVYIDGDLSNGYTASDFNLINGAESTAHIIILGNNINGTIWAPFDGSLDDVRVYDHTLSDTNIAALAYVTPQLTQAADPSPANGTTDVEPDTVLSWSLGDFAVSHDVYFGQNYDDVFNADNDSSAIFKGNQTETFFTPGSLLSSTTYYWRIDEVNSGLPGSPLNGEVWSFTTSAFIPPPESVEDFDDYTDDAELLAVWDDGSTNGSGSTVALAVPNTWMQLDYDNSAAPYQSDTTRQFSPPQNWDAFNLKSLSLNIKGQDTNVPDSLHLYISDGTSTADIVHPEPTAILNNQWQSWDIALSDISSQGVVLSNIVSVTISVGNGTAAAGTGTVLIDDIVLFVSRCMAEYTPAVDLDLDCDVDLQDMLLLVANWMLADYQVDAVAPNDSNLRA